jgi:hypothetical protein
VLLFDLGSSDDPEPLDSNQLPSPRFLEEKKEKLSFINLGSQKILLRRDKPDKPGGN